ncbi:MAG: GGDEF domain-containing protein [Kosmotogaceae bacterium]|nr:GGDEF domain-containing protein [Kosmotogaceae bacterium]
MVLRRSDLPVENGLEETAIDRYLGINLRRILYISLISIPVHAVFFLVFFFDNITSDAEAVWRTGIMTVHGIMALAQLAIAFFWVKFRINSRRGFLRTLFQYAVIGLMSSMLIALATIDQLVTTNITPFILLCIGLGAILIVRPMSAAILFGIISVAFCLSIGILQDDRATVLTNRVNGVGFAVFGMCLSLIIWNIYKKSIEQEIEIEKQQEELEEKNRELQRLAYLDTLTGLYNRRKWLELVEEEINIICRYENVASIILMDLDDFKETNDQFGHPAGDVVLEEIAQLLTDNLRVVDKPCRWGGEEFIILLPQIPLRKAETVAEKIRAVIEKTIFSINGFEISIEASFGVASLKCEENAFKESYSKADKALYEAKRKGRNRVEIEEDLEK